MQRTLWTILIGFIGFSSMSLMVLITGFFLSYPQIIRDFKTATALLDKTTVIYDQFDRPFTSIDSVEDRLVVPLNQISHHLQLSVLATEDARFFQHRGLDMLRILGALWANVKGGGYRQGGSTITQQLAKVTLLSPEKTLTRKLKEMVIAIALERQFSKWEILEHYLNTIYLGYGRYGVEQASLAYFGKPSKELSLGESAFIAGLIKRPEGYFREASGAHSQDDIYFPKASLKKAFKRQRTVLSQLKKNQWISEDEYQQARNEELRIFIPSNVPRRAPYFVQHVLSLLKHQFQLPRVSSGGYHIYTTIHPALQSIAETKVAEVFDQVNRSFSQAALVSLDPQSGHVHALVGGKDFSESQFNRVTQAKRQPGSVFKTFVFATAFESQEFQINTSFFDELIPFEWQEADGSISVYEPRNFDRAYGAERPRLNAYGEPYYEDQMTLGYAFEHSVNTVAVQLLYALGINKVVRKGKELKLNIPNNAGLCLALGCSEVKLLDLTAAYTPFMNQGYYSPPVFIRKIIDNQGKVIYEHPETEPKQVFSEWTVHQMNQMLHGVVTRGTGISANWPGNYRFTGGKTGTNTEYRDAWFVGYTPELITGVWVGNDDNSPMHKESGSDTPAALWSKFMETSLDNLEKRSITETVAYQEARTCRVSGALATENCPDTTNHHYLLEEIPQDTCPLHPGSMDIPHTSSHGFQFSQQLDHSFSDL